MHGDDQEPQGMATGVSMKVRGMEKSDLIGMEALKNTCNRLVLKHPEAIGMAVIELDCGCLNICGVSMRGEPVGSMKTILAGATDGASKNVICSRCFASKGRLSDRIVNQKIIWPGGESEQPERDLRLYIGQKVFGEDYVE